MKTFAQFLLTETPTETENLVPAAVYFQHPVEWMAPAVIEALKAGVRSGTLNTQRLRIPVASLIPTQEKMNNAKVISKVSKDTGSKSLSIVQKDRDGYVLIDGHHRACAAVVTHTPYLDVECILH